jgi:chemotaxis family two-component system response regulator PixG
MLYVQWGLVDLIAVPDLGKSLEVKTLPNPENLILYLNQSPDKSDNLASALSSQGYHLLTCSHGSMDALALCLEKKPTAILMNARLTPLDGYEVCRQLRQVEYFRSKPILIVSEQRSLQDKIRAKIAGASELVDQPSLMYGINNILAQYLGNRS